MPNAPRDARPPGRQTSAAQLVRERDAWLRRIDSAAHFYTLFDHLPGVCFYCKDARGRFMLVSRGFLQHHQKRHERELLGLTDFDVAPSHMASGYVSDDARLLRGETSCIERVELWFDQQGTQDWFFVSKLPLKDERGRICGTAGVVRKAAEHEMELPIIQGVARAVAIIRRDFAGPLLISQVARTCGLSLRHFQRRFHQAFGFSPQEFLIRTRVIAAMKLLEETSLSARQIAASCGFIDASGFSEQFRRRVGQSPSAYRSAMRSFVADGSVES